MSCRPQENQIAFKQFFISFMLFSPHCPILWYFRHVIYIYIFFIIYFNNTDLHYRIEIIREANSKALHCSYSCRPFSFPQILINLTYRIVLSICPVYIYILVFFFLNCKTNIRICPNKIWTLFMHSIWDRLRGSEYLSQLWNEICLSGTIGVVFDVNACYQESICTEFKQWRKLSAILRTCENNIMCCHERHPRTAITLFPSLATNLNKVLLLHLKYSAVFICILTKSFNF